MIEYRPAKKVTEVDAASKTVLIEGIEDVKGDVINVIPPQRAGQIAVAAGLVGADKNWCPVNPTTFESTIHKDIHVIGDACVAGAMPKSGYSANSEAKVCATNIVDYDERQGTRRNVRHQHLLQLPHCQGGGQVTGVYKVDKEKNAIVAVPVRSAFRPTCPSSRQSMPRAGSRTSSPRCRPDRIS